MIQWLNVKEKKENFLIMEHIKTLVSGKFSVVESGKTKKTNCGECQASCQSACKTSCTVGNQKCENTGE